MSAPAQPRRKAILVALALLAGTLALYGRVAHDPFVNYDDPAYVSANPAVSRGLTWEGVRWAFTSTSYQYNWHPLTWLAHMLDVELFGLEAGGHHLVSAGLHALNAALLFLALRGLTGRLWPSALVAALFAAHPLRVESVAWIAERKDLLAGTFFALTLLAYGRYARSLSVGRYLLVFLALGAGLMAKPTLVMVPFVLLLLDWWPLDRCSSRLSVAPRIPSLAPTHPGGKPRSAEGGSKGSGGSLRRGSPEARAARRWPRLWSAEESPRRVRAGFALFLEKLPLLMLCLGSAAITFLAQREGGAVNRTIPPGARIENALVACAAYLGRTLWPADLAVFYPHPAIVAPERSQLFGACLAAVLLAALSCLAWSTRRRAPWVALGWLWFLAMLLPMVGLVQVGDQARADRYAYLPLIGVYLALAWSLAEIVAARPALRPAAWGAGALALLALSVATWRQLGAWQSSRALFEHALEVTEGNYVAHNNLGLALADEGRADEALEHFEAARAILPGFFQAELNVGKERNRRDEIELARTALEAAVRSRPRSAEARFCLGVVLARAGEHEAADRELREALRLAPAYAEDPAYQKARAALDRRLQGR